LDRTEIKVIFSSIVSQLSLPLCKVKPSEVKLHFPEIVISVK